MPKKVISITGIAERTKPEDVLYNTWYQKIRFFDLTKDEAITIKNAAKKAIEDYCKEIDKKVN